MDLEVKKEFEKLQKMALLGTKKAFTMNDAALFTGLSKSHMYKLVCKKKIPHYKSDGGKFTYFDKDELTAWMLQHRVKTSDELETEAANYIVAGKRKGGKNV
jgi:excisionase family DNA binding protein